jgi:hypothetical protein
MMAAIHAPVFDRGLCRGEGEAALSDSLQIHGGGVSLQAH